MSYVFLLFAAVFVYMAFIHDALKELRSSSWPCAQGVIESCSEYGLPEDGRQSYYFIYIFRVDDVRQGGTFVIWEKSRRLKEMQDALVGLPVTVRYNPEDCTDCRVEESRLLGYEVSNSTH
jgi:hypothetical protein